MKMFAINSGSSSIKFRLYEMPSEEVIMKGSFERIGSKDSFYSIKFNGEKYEENVEMHDHKEAVELLLKLLIEKNIVATLDEIKAVGHRTVHGGSKYANSVIIDEEVINTIDEYKAFAPLHNPAGLLGIKAFIEAIPNALQVACFDTAFHQTIKEENYLYPIPYEYYEKYGIRKYGFHGLSHRFISLKIKELLNKDKVNVIVCHIGNGASISCVKEDVCIDTSMGFTPNSGLMMGTRSGDIDYSLIGYVMNKENISFNDVDTILNKKSGLQGIAGMNDLRDIDEAYENGDSKVKLAINMYTRRIANYVANYYLELDGKVDAIVFTAGGGENDPIIREEVINKLKALNITIDITKNNETLARKGIEGVISTENSSIPVYVLGTDEELMIAQDTYNLLNK